MAPSAGVDVDGAATSPLCTGRAAAARISAAVGGRTPGRSAAGELSGIAGYSGSTARQTASAAMAAASSVCASPSPRSTGFSKKPSSHGRRSASTQKSTPNTSNDLRPRAPARGDADGPTPGTGAGAVTSGGTGAAKAPRTASTIMRRARGMTSVASASGGSCASVADAMALSRDGGAPPGESFARALASSGGSRARAAAAAASPPRVASSTVCKSSSGNAVAAAPPPKTLLSAAPDK